MNKDKLSYFFHRILVRTSDRLIVHLHALNELAFSDRCKYQGQLFRLYQVSLNKREAESILK